MISSLLMPDEQASRIQRTSSKNRITRSRKLGVMVKNKINKNEGKIKEENDKKDLEENSIQISVNKINEAGKTRPF